MLPSTLWESVLPSPSCGMPNITTLTQHTVKGQKEYSSLSGLYSLALNPLERTESQTHDPCFPLPTPAPPIMAEPGRVSWNITETIGWLAASDCRKAEPGTHKPGDQQPATSHHRHCVLRLKQLGHIEDAHLKATGPHPKLQARQNKNLCYSSTCWKIKEIVLLIHLLNSEKTVLKIYIYFISLNA